MINTSKTIISKTTDQTLKCLVLSHYLCIGASFSKTYNNIEINNLCKIKAIRHQRRHVV